MANQESTELASIPLPSIPQEIIIDILLRLPVKSLLKFRCVSKSWLSIISNPQFVKTQPEISTKISSYSRQRLIFGLVPQYTDFYSCPLYPNEADYSCIDIVSFDYPLSDLDVEIRIVGSCNGLICLALIDTCIVIVWNPATRISRGLPVSCDNIFRMTYGFGYDVSNDDYKVVEFSWISPDGGAFDTQVRVYSLRNDSWKIVDWPDGKIMDESGVFVNGAIHWKVYYNDNLRDWNVIAQNVTTEECEIVALPTCESNDEVKVTLGVSGGLFCACYDYHSYMDVWVLKEYGVRDSWSKLVCFPYFLCARTLVIMSPKLLFIWENGWIFLKNHSDLIMYKPFQYRVVHHLSDKFEVEATAFSESLISPYLDGQLFLQAPLPA